MLILLVHTRTNKYTVFIVFNLQTTVVRICIRTVKYTDFVGMRFDRCGERTPTHCSEWRRRASARSAYWRRFLAVAALRASGVLAARCSTLSAHRLSRSRCCCSSLVVRCLQTPPLRRHESTRVHFSTQRNFTVSRSIEWDI